MNSFFRRRFLLALTPGAALAGSPAPSAPTTFNVRQFGASGDGARLDTKPVQDAIDACTRAGGGTVQVPAGTYLSGTLVLKSRVTLHLEAGATLLGSKNLADYPPHVARIRSYTDTYTEKSLVYAEGAENIAIAGRGTIDGQGAAFKGPYKVRPYVIRSIDCRDVSVTGVTIKDSPMWVQHYMACDGVEIRGITVRSRVNANNDGIDIDACQRVRISDCDIWCGDDAIVLKSTLDRPCKDVVITNCVLSTLCNALKLGTESNGGFENIAISNCSIYDTRLAGIAVEMVDGGLLDRVSMSNIVMNGVGTPIFVRLGDRARPFFDGGPRPPVGKLRNVVIRDVQADNAGPTGCAIAGLQDHPLEGITLDNIRLSFAGGEKAVEREVPENPDKYPEHSMFGKLPAYGLYFRHVNDLALRSVRTTTAAPDQRHAVYCDDVDTLEISGARFATVEGGAPALRLKNVRRALVHGCRTDGPGAKWLRVEGGRTRRIVLTGNDLAGAGIDAAADVSKESIITKEL